MRLQMLCTAIVLSTFAGTASAACDPVPYSVQAKETRGRVVVAMPAKYSDPSNVPKPASVAAGGEYIRSMYAAMGPTVVREVLGNYACRFNAAVDADTAVAAEAGEAYKAAFQAAIDDLIGASSLYFPAFAAQNFVQAQALRPTLESAPPLSKSARVPTIYLSQAFGTISDKDFLIEDSYGGYLQGSFNGIEATACGKLIRAALAENAGLVQHLAASLRATLNTYFSVSAAGVKSAMTMLYAEAASAASVTLPAKTENRPLLGGCAT